MSLYEIDGIAPVLPQGGEFWIAPGAQVLGRVLLHAGASV